MQCSNNLKQLSLGCLTHESATGRFPTNGWGWLWLGDPDRGTGIGQPGGWIFNILPYIELQSLHDLQSGKSGAARLTAAAQTIQTPLSVLNCPSRRQNLLYPQIAISGLPGGNTFAGLSDAVSALPRSDYAANCGDRYSQHDEVPGDSFGSWGPSSLSDAESSTGSASFAAVAKIATGVVYAGSLVRMADVSDGTTNTYLIGEKYLNPDNYATGTDSGDNETIFSGDNGDFARWTDPNRAGGAPRQDTPGYPTYYLFGSAHSSGFNMAFCDGSVRSISYNIDVSTHRWLGNRKDGNVVDGNSY
jgi:prepilin-type processing-associated H-X9-DG protein